MTRKAAAAARAQQLELPYPMGRAIDDNDVWEACFSKHDWSTRKDIADAIGRSVHPALVNRIERMVEDRLLERDTYTLRNGAKGYRYRALESGE
jgi:predicted transcriptional regulator